MTENCKSCKVVDDENPRLNNCDLWRERNYLDKNYKANFSDIYSNDFVVLNKSIMEIQSVWALQYTSGRMKKPSLSLDVNPTTWHGLDVYLWWGSSSILFPLLLTI